MFLSCLLLGLRHPSTGALGWGQVKMAASRIAHTIECTPISLPPVFLSPQWPQPPPPFPGASTKPANTAGSGSYEVTAFSLGPSAHKTLCAPSNHGISVSLSSIELLYSSPTGLQSQMLWGLFLQTPRLRKLTWGSELSLL